MGDKPASRFSAKLSSLFDSSGGKSQARQFVENYFGIQYIGNTIFSLACVHFIKKVMPGMYDKMAGHYEKKYLDKASKRNGVEIPADPDAPLSDEQRKLINEAKAYGDKTAESRLLCTGGFAMLPFSSAYDVYYKKGGQITDADGTIRKPRIKEVILGKDNASNMPKWIAGRTIGLGAAFYVQRIVDDRFGKHKEAVDFTVARILTRIMGKQQASKAGAGDAFGEAQSQGLSADETIPKDINPRILKNVRMVTSDFYMTSVALASMAVSNFLWDKAGQRLPDSTPSFVRRLMTGNATENSKGI